MLNFILLSLMFLSTFANAEGESFPAKFDLLANKKTTGKLELVKSYQLSIENKNPWKICVSLPNVYDKYWWSASYGLSIAEKIFGVSIAVFDAGGYANTKEELENLKKCTNLKPDAIIIAAISDSSLENELKRIEDLKIPVIDLIQWN